jgi:hypothetical protein
MGVLILTPLILIFLRPQVTVESLKIQTEHQKKDFSLAGSLVNIINRGELHCL